MHRAWLVPLMALCAVLAACGPQNAGSAGRSGSGQSTGTALIGGPFTLVDQDGRPVDESRLKGRWSAVFFGFTYCPDVCPATLQSLAQAQDLLGAKAKDLQIVLISVDPERDTPQALKAYLTNQGFPRDVLALTGTPEQVASAAKAYRAFYQKTGEGEDYVVDHVTYVHLMDPDGRFVRILTYDLTPQQVAEQIAQAMREGA